MATFLPRPIPSFFPKKCAHSRARSLGYSAQLNTASFQMQQSTVTNTVTSKAALVNLNSSFHFSSPPTEMKSPQAAWLSVFNLMHRACRRVKKKTGGQSKTRFYCIWSSHQANDSLWLLGSFSQRGQQFNSKYTPVLMITVKREAELAFILHTLTLLGNGWLFNCTATLPKCYSL